MPKREYIIFCDESDKTGPHYCNFYGGVLVGASQYQKVTQRLEQVKIEQNLHKEIKWQKVTDKYLPKYESLMQAFFDELRTGHLKVRIMFRQTALEPASLTLEQRQSSYYILYYQFIKHAFGLKYIPQCSKGTALRLYFDQFPDTGEQVTQFKGYIEGLEQSKHFQAANIHLRPENIAEVRSHEHVLLQCIDVVLGAMQFRLNDKHKQKPPGQRCRGKRTIAKEKLYKFILRQVRTIYPNFNIGITTGLRGNQANQWEDPYRHWAFRPHDHKFHKEKTKGWKRKNPT